MAGRLKLTPQEQKQLSFDCFDTKTPASGTNAFRNPKQYCLISSRLFDHSVQLASNPEIVERLKDTQALSRDDRIERLVMASYIPQQIEQLTGLRLPNLTDIMSVAARQQDGPSHFDSILGHMLDAFDGISKLVEPASETEKQAIKQSIAGSLESMSAARGALCGATATATPP